jgi:hypothetical protein
MRGKTAHKAQALPPLLAEFVPVAMLWQGDAPRYPSEQSARWDLRDPDTRAALLEAGALALHRGRLFVHPQRHAQVIERLAVERLRRRQQREAA